MSGMKKRVATCACGQLRVHTDGEPVRVGMCHCFACQQRTGSVFGVQARFDEFNVKIEGNVSTWVRTGDEGGKVTMHFCPTCASTVCWKIDKLPGFIAVAVGAFAEPTFMPPSVSIYEVRRHPWTKMPEHKVELYD